MNNKILEWVQIIAMFCLIALIVIMMVLNIHCFFFRQTIQYQYVDTAGKIGISNNCNIENMTCEVDSTTFLVVSIKSLK